MLPTPKVASTRMELRYIDESRIRLWREQGSARLRCEIADELCVLQASVRRCFPLSHTDEFVSLAGSDGKEVGLIKHPSQLDDESRKLVAEELDRLYFTPTISRIVNLKQEASMWKWDVTTQRGDAQFYLRGVRDSVHEVAPGRFQIYSVDGQRYELRDYDKLDARTQNLFESLF